MPRNVLQQLVLEISLLLALVVMCHGRRRIGVCFGRFADNLPSPEKVAKLVQQRNIRYVRIYDSDIHVLEAFANTGVELVIGIPNLDLLAMAQFRSNADAWLRNNILPYYPATKITHISVGAEVTERPDNVSALVAPAMENVHAALTEFELHDKIKISSAVSLGILSRSFPPSAGTFHSNQASFLKPLLEFLAATNSPFMINLYPYYAYIDSPANVSLDYALLGGSIQVIDPNNGLLYTNMFDAQIDALYFALAALHFRTIKIMVTETGWPSKGSRKEIAANPKNAYAYNTNLIRHVMYDLGTPAKHEQMADVYIFSLFNENRKRGVESERNWGIFTPNLTSIYGLDFTAVYAKRPNSSSSSFREPTWWCIARNNASRDQLQNALDWVCSSGTVDCSAIQPSQPCYQPDTLISHASYAFNSYYQHQGGRKDIDCNFSGMGLKVSKDPSYDRCLYTTIGGNRPSVPTVSSSRTENPTWTYGLVIVLNLVAGWVPIQLYQKIRSGPFLC